MCSKCALALYILDISMGGRQDMYTKRLVGSVVSRARHVMTSSCVVRGDCRLCLRSDTRKSVYVVFLRRTDVYIMRE